MVFEWAANKMNFPANNAYISHKNTNKGNISIYDIHVNKIVKNTNYIRPDPADKRYDKVIKFTSTGQNLHA